MCQIASKDWRFDLERGKMIDAAAELAWKQAAQPILVQDDPFNALMRSLDADMEDLARFFALTRSPIAWSERFVELLTGYHERSHMLGQGRSAIQPLAQGHAYQVMNIGRGGLGIPEADFVLGFLNDLMLEDERYFKEGEVDQDEILRRMRMYQGKMRGSAGWGFIDPKPPLTEFYWRLGGAEEHCEDCPLNASKSPWYKETLYTTPGAGDTPCLFNCRCFLEEAETGEISALPVLREAA